MKRLVTTLAAVFVIMSASAQFILTPDGIISSSDPSKDYVVVNLPDKSQQEIFEAIESYVYANFNYKGCTIETLPYQTISVYVDYSRRNENTIVLKGPDFNQRLNADLLSYIITYKVKDGKLRMDIPRIKKSGMILMINGVPHHAALQALSKKGNKTALFDRDGKPVKNKKEIIRGIEQYFNNMLHEPLSLMTDNDW